jgi:acyl-lipid omega-6 desaturase (Delta-12 desaturase)
MSQIEEGGTSNVGTSWAVKLNGYRTPSLARAIVEIAITAIPFALLWYAMYWSLSRGHVAFYLLLVLPAAGFLVRLFLIQHDCGHYAFFESRRANDWVGRFISIVTLTPYDHWRRAHAIHHATSGDLRRRGVGDVDTITVAEYQARSRWTRLRYRLYRHPAVMFGIGPTFIFVLQNRIPAGFMRVGWRPWASTMATNLGIAIVVAALVYTVGMRYFLLVNAPILLVGATMGGWLFYVQHQFTDTYWENGDKWNIRDAALEGSSHYDLPPVLKWFTANIGVHHVHHLSSRIPYYRLPRVLRDHPELRTMNRLTLWESIKCVRLVLWDEKKRQLISFAQFRRQNEPLAAV